MSGSRLWAFWRRTFIPCQDGLKYLVRLQIVRTPWFGIYMHDIYGADDDPHPHNHPWSFVSIILRGWYQEQLYPRSQFDRERFRVQTWRRFSVHRMTRDAAHRIIDTGGGCKTLIFVGPRRGAWGFFDDNGFVPWDDYEGLSKQRLIEGGESLESRRWGWRFGRSRYLTVALSVNGWERPGPSPLEHVADPDHEVYVEPEVRP